MKYLAAIRSTLVIFAVMLLSSVSFIGHANAAMPVHDMSGDMGSHTSTQTPACQSLCNPAALRDEQAVLQDVDDEDDEPGPLNSQPYYALFNRFAVPKKLASSYVHDQLVLRPPDLVKLYSNYRF